MSWAVCVQLVVATRRELASCASGIGSLTSQKAVPGYKEDEGHWQLNCLSLNILR